MKQGCKKLKIFSTAVIAAILHFTPSSFSAQEKGLLPEVTLNSNNEQENLERAAMSEALISKTEIKAIEAINKLLLKKKGSSDEPNLLYRLAELHMRRAKSGRFFEINKPEKQKILSAFPVAVEGDKESLRNAIKSYNRLETEFPKFQEMDSVLFNSAFAHQQLRLSRVAEAKLKEMITKFPNSPMITDALLALGELQYDFQNFSEALKTYRKIEAYPNSRVFAYGLYKSAWAAYNQKNTALALEQLKAVLKNTPATNEANQRGHHLRGEALRDLGIFIADNAKPEEIYPFFKQVSTPEELSKIMIEMAKMYDSFSRQKDLLVFLKTFTENEPMASGYVTALLMMVDANETLKKRNLVLENLELASKACQVSSAWRKEQQDSTIDESCKTQFKHYASEITKKWWDIWLKNQNNKGKEVEEFAELTEKSFVLLLANDDPTKPDFKSRYAYAELLFQKKKYLEASDAYVKAAADSTDPQLRHDADYSALLSLDRHLENNKSEKLEIQRRLLVENYLKNNPKGEHVRTVTLKLALLQFNAKEIKEATTSLQSLLATTKPDEVQTKAQDLLLEILNQTGQTTQIKILSAKFRNDSVTSERKQSLNQIFEEASLAEIQAQLKDKKEEVAIKSLEEFLTQKPSDKMRLEAAWQLLGLLFKSRQNQKAIARANEFIQTYPADPRSKEAATEITRIRIEQADLDQAADYYVKNQDFAKATQMWWIESDYAKLLAFIKSNESSKSSTLTNSLTEQLWNVKQNLSATQREELSSWIVTKQMEPMATQIMTEEAEKIAIQGNPKKLYDFTMKILKRNSPTAFRAKAKLLQSEILEAELKSQSLKAREDKLALVIAMKTEKLDKAQTSYLSVLKMSADPKLQIAALNGVHRVYKDYIDGLTNMALPITISEPEQAQFKKELKAIIDPMTDKLAENDKKISELEKSIPMMTTDATPLRLRSFIPVKFTTTLQEGITVLEGKKSACNSAKELSLQSLADCAADKKFDQIQTLADKSLQSGEASDLALYAKAIVAASRNKTTKALWIIERLLSKNEKAGFFVYEKARLLNQMQDVVGSSELFVKLADANNSLTEIRIFSAVREYKKQNFVKASELFSLINIDELYTYQVNTIALDSHRLAGQLERAKKLQEQEQKFKNKTVGQNVSSGDLL